MRAGDEQFGDGVFILRRHTRAALATTVLGTESRQCGPFDVAAMGDGDDHFLTLHKVFVIKPVPAGGDFAQAWRRKFGVNGDQLCAQNRIKLYAVAQNCEEFCDTLCKTLKFFANFITTKRRQAVQAQFKNGANLKLRQLIAVARNFGFNRFHQFDVRSDFRNWPFARDQRGARLGRAGRSANDADNFVQIGDGNNKAKQQMRTFARFVQFELGSAGDDLFTEADERFDDVAQVEDFRTSAANGEHIGGEARLCLCVAPQLVEHHICGRIALQIDDDAHALAAGFIANVGNTLNALVLRGFRDFFDQTGFADLKRNAG